ncbi:MAG: hypothetical protein ACTHQM_17495 [Thermoanaerobaculia bacterium]
MRSIAKQILSRNFVIFFCTVVANALAVRFRPVAMVDTPLYVDLADQARHGSWSGLLSPFAPHWTKITFLSVLATARTLSNDHWMYLVFLVNLVCSGLVAVMLARIVWRATNAPVPVATALVFYWTGFDIIVWVRTMLTDTMYAAAALAVFAVIALDIFDSRARARYGWLVPALMAAILTRVPGLLLIPLTAIAYALFVEPPEKRRLQNVWIGMLVMVALGAPFIRAALVNNPALWPTDYLRPRVERLAARANDGVVVNGRPELARPAPRSVADHVIVQADRFVRFFQFLSSDFSAPHNIIAGLWFGLLYALGGIGAMDALRAADWRRRSLAGLCLLWIVAYAWFFALTELDYDWRYRMPVLPQFIILAACGIDALLRSRLTRLSLAAQ